MNVQTEGIILKTQKYKEFDEILTVFTKKFGKLNMFARSSKRIKSPLLSGTQLFGYVDMEIDLRETGSKLFTSKIKKSYYKFSEDLSKYYFASYICELIEKTQQENQTDVRLFNKIIEIFNLIELGNCNFKLLRLIFELHLLKSLGISPHLNNCMICETYDMEIMRHIDISGGSIVCENCIKKNNLNAYRLDKNLIRFIKYVYNNDIAKCLNVKIADILLEQLDKFIQVYISSYYGNLNINSYLIVKGEENINDNFRKN